MKKKFDCVEMKRKIQERIFNETRDLSPDQELAYFHEAAKALWRDITALRNSEVKKGDTSKKSPKKEIHTPRANP